MSISELAVVSKKAKIGKGVEIGPFAIIEDGVELADRVKVWPHAYICTGTTIGEDTQIHMGAVIGHTPQDHAFQGGKTFVRIGKRNIIREYATIHRGTKEGTSTVIGDDCYLMAVSHVGHNCEIGNKVIIANGALLAGYVLVEEMAFISGNVVIHQFCRIGKLAMIGGFTGINKDVPPFMLARGPSVVRAINVIGLRRAKVPNDVIRSIKEAFKCLYMSDLNTPQAIEAIKKLKPSEELSHLLKFIQESKRGICKNKESDAEYFDI
jgi:UDP-N-acetylglucosamine acyltransferase